MVLFFQFDVRQEFGLPFPATSHFLAFACPVCGGITDLHLRGEPLPDEYWERAQRGMDGVGYSLLLVDGGEPAAEFEGRLEHRALTFERVVESLSPDGGDVAFVQPIEGFPGTSRCPFEPVRGMDGFKIGGQPSFPDPIDEVRCCCGSEMVHVVSVPEGAWLFEELESLPCDGFFLQNYVSLFACRNRCQPGAVFPCI